MSLYDMMNARVYARKPDKRGGMMDARVGDVSVPVESPQQKSQSVMTAPAEGMQNARVYNTIPTATEEKAPVPKTYAVKNSEAIASVAAPVQEAPKAVTETPQKKPYTHWWQTPEYLGEVNRRAADAEKRAEQDRKRAVRQRNAAILGDLAKLGAQMYAKNGGAWKIDAFTPATEKANDKLAALRERHAAEVAAFAKERAAARQAIAADNNARMKLETSLAEADAERKRREKEREEGVAFRNQRAAAQDNMDQKNYELRVKEHNRLLAQQGKPGQYLAYDRYGNEKWHDSEQAAETFSRNEGTWHEEDHDEVSTENYIDEMGDSRTRTITRKKKKGYSKKPTSPMNKKNNQGDGAY